MVDLKDLSKYVVVLTGEQSLDGVDDLRELEADFGAGVYPLWSDGLQSIVAFAFEPGHFKEEEARAWVQKAMEKKSADLSLASIIQAVVGPIVRALGGGRDATVPKRGVGLRSFDEARRLVGRAVDEQYGKVDSGGIKEYPWVVDMGDSMVILEVEGERYAVTYQIDASDQVTLGELEPVDEQWVRGDGSPVMLHAFSTRLADGDEADDDDDGLTWKEIIHPGKWFKADSGRLMEVTAEMIKEAFRAWQAGLPKLISVPTAGHYDHAGGLIPAEANRGFVEKLKLIGDRLFAGFKFTDPEVGYGVGVGSIADVSVYLQPSVIHPVSGEKFKWVLEHVLLTNSPLAQDLAPFGDVPLGASSGEGRCMVQFYQQKTEEVNDMKNEKDKDSQGGAVTLSAEDVTTLEQFKGLGLSVADVKAMVAERDQVRQRARDLEITKVVRALEAQEEHAGVVQVDGRRHYPVVCVALEKALREQPAGLALSANDEGQTGFDTVILDIVNAIPSEGRMALDAGDGPAGSKNPADSTLTGPPAEPSDEQIDQLAARL